MKKINLDNRSQYCLSRDTARTVNEIIDHINAAPAEPIFITATGTDLDRYKFRAECFGDVVEFINVTGQQIKNIVINRTKTGYPDCEVTMVITDTNCEKIRKVMLKVSDNHIMIETLSYESAYTGDRWFTEFWGGYD